MRILLFVSFILLSLLEIKEVSAQGGGIGTDGMYVPRMRTTRRDSIVNPGNGQLIYNTDHNCFNVYQKNAWQKLCGFDITFPGSWVQKANIGGGGRFNAVSFSIGNKGYVGTGYIYPGPQAKNDFWEYDPATDVWTQKANVGGDARKDAVGFSIGNKGYIGTGYGYPVARNDFWEYNPATNVWTQKANFGGGGRYSTVGFSIGSKGYVGTGYTNNEPLNDFWEYNPITDVWTQKASIGSFGRFDAVGFSVGGKGYIGAGDNYVTVYLGDFWEYNPATDVWIQKANFGGGGRRDAVGFSIGNKGYIGAGYTNENGGIHKNDFWEYNPATGVWIQKPDVEGGGRVSGVGFSIGSKGYIGTGLYREAAKNDFWEYDSAATNLTMQANQFNEASRLIKSDASGNLALNGNLNIGGEINNPDFIASTLNNGWANYGDGFADASFYKDKESMVRLKGVIRSGTIAVSTVMFTLPVGYRPSEIMIFAVANSDLYGRVDVYPNGEVRFISGSNIYLSLDGIRFRVN
jgi:hypothetical protein